MIAPKPTTFYRWDDMPREKVNDLLDRRLVTAERMMLAQIHLMKGCIVPRHSHENEQITYVLRGEMRFWIGAEPGESLILKTGEVLVIPSLVPHMAEALEETLEIDVFSPPRQDWLDGTDHYLRGK
jgi:quercetin dioxygenase-like cupin family protein